MNTPFSNPSRERDMHRLKTLLENSFAKAGIEPSKQTHLLNLACGRADESGVLAEVFGKNGIHLTGLDIRAREISEADGRWEKYLPEHASAEFLVQDCSKLSDITHLPNNFDIAFMRHQNFWNGDTTWCKIYDEALHRLDENGHLIITSYFDREHALALEAIQSLGAELVLTEKNCHSRLVQDTPSGVQKSVDRHIAIFKKP